MKIFFQEKDFKYNKELDLFSKKNKKAGSIVSFLGKVRPKNNNKKLKYMEIECYKKMASFQTRKIVDSFLDEDNFIDYKIIHRFGKLLPTDNIVLILVASKHRKIGCDFIETLLIWFKSKITFWKKEVYFGSYAWLQKQK